MATPVKPEGNGPICPECGRDPRADPPRPLLLRHPWLVPLILLSILVAVVYWKNATLDWTLTAPRWTESEGFRLVLEFPDERITPQDVQAMAEGARDAAPLLDMVMSQQGPGNKPIHAAFVPPDGERTDAVRYGWPLQVYFARKDVEYGDVFSEHGTRLTSYRVNEGLLGWAFFWKSVAQNGVTTRCILMLDAIVAMLALLVVAWCAGRLLRDVAWLVRLARRSGSRFQDRLAKRLPLLVFGGVAGLCVVRSTWFPDRNLHMYPIPVTAPTAPIGLTRNDLATIPPEDRGHVLAKAILDASPPISPADADDACLAITWDLPTSIVSTNIVDTWPRGVMGGGVHQELGLAGEPTWTISDYDTSYLTLQRSATKGAWYAEMYTFRLSLLALLLSIPIGIGLLWSAILRGLRWRQNRRSRRRTAAGLCVHCAYDVGS